MKYGSEIGVAALAVALVGGYFALTQAQATQTQIVPQPALGISPDASFDFDLADIPADAVNTNFAGQATPTTPYGEQATLQNAANGGTTGGYVPLFGFLPIFLPTGAGS